MSEFSEVFDEYMQIKIFVDSNDEMLLQAYLDNAREHNSKLIANPNHYDAGFDIYLPEEINSSSYNSSQIKVDYKIKCCAHIVKYGRERATAFYTYGRSSISNTNLRLANNQGIIDAGYRGNLMAKFDVISSQTHIKFSRLMQICAPSLLPIHVVIVNKLEDLGEQTLRGTGGFGSTGI
jgi:dUTPase